MCTLTAVPASRALSEHESKNLLAGYGVPVNREALVQTPSGAVAAARDLGHPVVLKLCGADIAHKTELGAVRLDLVGDEVVEGAAAELLALGHPGAELLVAEQVSGTRELITGVTDDPQFGAALMLGVGGIFAELIADVVFRLLPARDRELRSMFDDLAHPAILGRFRGEPPVDRDALAAVLAGLAACALDHPEVESIDVNPLIVADGMPVAVDALVVLR